MTFWIVQGLGLVSLVFFVCSLQMKTKEKLLIMTLFACAAFALQFYLSGSMTGMAGALLAIARGVVFYIYKKRNLDPSVAVLVIFSCLIIVLTIITWKDMLSILPFLAMFSNLYSQWQNNMKILRIFTIIASALWFSYEFHLGMYTGMVTEACICVSGAVALWRFRKGASEDKGLLG